MGFKMQISSMDKTAETFLSDTVLLSEELLNTIMKSINNITTYTSQLEDNWNQELSQLTSDISRFVEVTTLVSKLMKAKSPDFLPNVKNSHIHLLFILKAMNQTQQKQDAVALEELIKYELKDNLTLWKIDLIPQTKRLLKA
jgi:hypothetical protein